VGRNLCRAAGANVGFVACRPGFDFGDRFRRALDGHAGNRIGESGLALNIGKMVSYQVCQFLPWNENCKALHVSLPEGLP
jgi:hypothetical protein